MLGSFAHLVLSVFWKAETFVEYYDDLLISILFTLIFMAPHPAIQSTLVHLAPEMSLWVIEAFLTEGSR